MKSINWPNFLRGGMLLTAVDIYEINKLAEFFARRHVAKGSAGFSFSACKHSDMALISFL